MRKVTQSVVSAFLRGEKAAAGNTATIGTALYLHGNLIAWKESEPDGSVRLTLSDAGWRTATTKDRLNGILQLAGIPARIYQEQGEWYMSRLDGGAPPVDWDGRWSFYLPRPASAEEMAA
jgi:hypothetical protein